MIDYRYTERWNGAHTVKLELLRCEAQTKKKTQCSMVPIYRHPDGRLLCAAHGYWCES